MTPVLEMKNASISLNKKLIIDNMNLKIQEHESVVFIGPSGGGKTILLKLLAGIYSPTAGDVFINGENWHDITGEHKHDLAKKLGMLFQQGALFDPLTVIENVAFPIREHYNLPEEEVLAKSQDLLEKVNLLDSKNKLPVQLSGGMQRRLGIARALALNPQIIFYDDPVAGQDPMQSDQMLRLISNFKEKNKSTLLMVTSNMKVAYRMADRIFMIIDHELIDAGTPKQILEHPDPRIQQFIHGSLDGPIKSL
ncbi:MAG: ATP-binding cassette domain-containing protein [Halobacteriovoraceae bacterium]|jgi:phospholipid/cholesterol/gamma-HCH transport system ATP-binding protein|nr:ATP-binding cassette domain-containing protein [Halobacteriovoraceae bacterium]